MAGLLALMLLTEARRDARFVDDALVSLGDQDRSAWDRALIAEGHALVRECLARNQPGHYQLMAAINAVHTDAATAEATDWGQVATLYNLLYAVSPTPIVALNRSIAIAELDGPAVGLALSSRSSSRPTTRGTRRARTCSVASTGSRRPARRTTRRSRPAATSRSAPGWPSAATGSEQKSPCRRRATRRTITIYRERSVTGRQNRERKWSRWDRTSTGSGPSSSTSSGGSTRGAAGRAAATDSGAASGAGTAAAAAADRRRGWPASSGSPRVSSSAARGPAAATSASRSSTCCGTSPLNGYQIIGQITERSAGAWKPSPGSVYPTLQQLEDEGLIEADEERGRRTFRLTTEGQAYVDENAAELDGVWTPFAPPKRDGQRAEFTGLKPEIGQVMGAVWQIVSTGSEAQRGAAIEVLVDTRRRLYGILAEGDAETDEEGDAS